ncbi:MAG: c-type cytochrome [Gammaproteobacteria bacterium]|nr:c-type cytochrome [Gammaproteobacteria bacterium]
MNHEDGLFMKRFSMIILVLVMFSIVLIFVARYMHGQLVPASHPVRDQMKLARIEPPTGVYTDAQAAASASAVAQPKGAFDGSLDPQQIYSNVCAACHTSGAAGAPMLQADQWSDRISKGTEALYASAINGIGIMPAKGGRSDLSDEQVKVAVDWMLDQLD